MFVNTPAVSLPLERLGTSAVNWVEDAVWISSSSPFRAVNPPAKFFGRTRLFTANVLFAVTVSTPPDTVATVLVALFGVGLHVNTTSSLFHHHSNGGPRITWSTICAAVSAGSREFPMTGLRLKDNRLQKSIVFLIVFVESAIG